MERIRVGVLFGGQSEEHDVSLRSARAVLAALGRAGFDPVPIAITPEGRWLGPGQAMALLEGARDGTDAGRAERAPVPQPVGALAAPPWTTEAVGHLDVVFPVLHGPRGEDGTVQGLLELLDLPYVGAGVLGSALGMDKAAQKDVLLRHGLPVVDYVLVRRSEWRADREAVVHRVLEAVGLPCFVKPANLGSSVGVSKARSTAELQAALDLAARFDRRLLCERAVDAREIECGVLGDDCPEVSVPGEVVPLRDFYDYEAKYGEGKSRLVVPADLDPDTVLRVRDLARQAFLALDGWGMARVDFFLERGTGALFVNELNTIPGFTETSMYPRLWEASGVPLPRLVARLIELALERHAEARRAARGEVG
jgi:D-alanine-D-alanine ligase